MLPAQGAVIVTALFARIRVFVGFARSVPKRLWDMFVRPADGNDGIAFEA